MVNRMMDDLFDLMEDDMTDETSATPTIASPDCGLYIILPTTDNHEKQCFQLIQALHAANRFSAYSVNRHVVEYRPAPSDADPLAIAKAYREVCLQNGFIFLVYDDVAIARASDADGVLCSSLKHCSEARRQLDESKIIGLRSCHKAAAQSALSLELDFVCFYQDSQGEPLIDLLNWWTTATEIPVAIEAPFDQENCAAFVAGGATFIEAGHHIWSHPSGNPMQGAVNMLDAFERHGHRTPPAMH